MRLTIPTGMYDDSHVGFDLIDGTDGEAISRWSTLDEAYAAGRRLLAEHPARYGQYGILVRNRRDFSRSKVEEADNDRP